MSQKIEITGRELDVTDRIREYVTQKVAKISRHLNAIEEIRIDLASIKTARSATDRYAAQLTVRGKNLLLRSEERADDIRTALDAALDKMTRQVARYKGRRDKGRGDGKSAAEVAPDLEPLPSLEPEEAPIILRRKQFDLIPMAEEEAIEQMKLLGHDNFFVFFNAKTSAINVLYRRNDGGYGLIEPRIR